MDELHSAFDAVYLAAHLRAPLVRRRRPKRLERLVNQPGKICWLVNAGLLPYAPACALQRQLVEARKAGSVPDVLLFCEHPHVITLGRNGKRENLRASDRLLAQRNVTLEESDRGGDITYHGPGQIVGYPILDLAEHRRDVRWYVRQLEETMIRASADFGVTAARVEGRHGIWVQTPAGEEKLAALGVHLSRWVSSHGFAYNVATDLRYFDLIVPCGIAGKRATSLERVLARAVRSEEVRPKLAAHFGELFERAMISVSRADLEEKLQHHVQHALAPRPSEVLELKGSMA
jgi:lipoyl(octanoyl) transferase